MKKLGKVTLGRIDQKLDDIKEDVGELKNSFKDVTLTVHDLDKRVTLIEYDHTNSFKRVGSLIMGLLRLR